MLFPLLPMPEQRSPDDSVKLAEMILRAFAPDRLPAFGDRVAVFREGGPLHEEAKRIIERNKK